MSNGTIDVYLLASFSLVLVSVLLAILARTRIPRDDELHSRLSTRGDVPMYHLVDSLRAKYFLPRVLLPDVSGSGLSTKYPLVLSRADAWLAVLVVAPFLFEGLCHAWA